jgi:hypothetical protein
LAPTGLAGYRRAQKNRAPKPLRSATATLALPRTQVTPRHGSESTVQSQKAALQSGFGVFRSKTRVPLGLSKTRIASSPTPRHGPKTRVQFFRLSSRIGFADFNAENAVFRKFHAASHCARASRSDSPQPPHFIAFVIRHSSFSALRPAVPPHDPTCPPSRNHVILT